LLLFVAILILIKNFNYTRFLRKYKILKIIIAFLT